MEGRWVNSSIMSGRKMKGFFAIFHTLMNSIAMSTLGHSK